MNIIPSRYETLPPNTTSVLGSRVLTLLQSTDEEKEYDWRSTHNQGRRNHIAFWIPEELDMCQPKQDEDQDSEANQGQE